MAEANIEVQCTASSGALSVSVVANLSNRKVIGSSDVKNIAEINAKIFDFMKKLSGINRAK